MIYDVVKAFVRSDWLVKIVANQIVCYCNIVNQKSGKPFPFQQVKRPKMSKRSCQLTSICLSEFCWFGVIVKSALEVRNYDRKIAQKNKDIASQ